MAKRKNKNQPKTYLELVKETRGSWNGVNPCTRVVESKKNYKRHDKHKGKTFEYERLK